MTYHTGAWRRPGWPELRETATTVRFTRGKLYEECLKSRECSEGLGDPLYSVTRLAPRWQQIRSPATAFL